MIYRVEVGQRDAEEGQVHAGPDALVRRLNSTLGIVVESVRFTHVYLIETDSTVDRVTEAARRLLADAITEQFVVIGNAAELNGAEAAASRIELHPKPGVMDPVAESAAEALRDLGLAVTQVRTGRGCVIRPGLSTKQVEAVGRMLRTSAVIEDVYFEPYLPEAFAKPVEQSQAVRHVAIVAMTEAELTQLSRRGHLFLSAEEMRAVQSHYRTQGREPTDIELETIAQTWSEHCVHKTLKSAVDVTEFDERGNVIGRRSYGNLIRETIFAATRTLMEGPAGEWCLSVFEDNAGVIALDDSNAVCMKVETHNHPSAIDPYGGSATGIGGCIRDILGTGLGAKPIAATDVFCVADPSGVAENLPRGVIHPRRMLEELVAGVRDYGNRMGIPTVNGAVYFDEGYLANPLVFCGCVGVLPRDAVSKSVRNGDAIVLMGGRTGRDGIHGATFSSAELTSEHADEFGHAVQIGNAITQKKMADVVLAARDQRLFRAITDCGAGGLSSAVGEMAAAIGAVVDLDRVPLKYAGLRYDEIWISEAQERMVLAVPKEKVESLLKLARSEDVEATVIGRFGNDADGAAALSLRYGGVEVGKLSVRFLHDGLPKPRRLARIVTGPRRAETIARSDDPQRFKRRLLELLARPDIASKHWIIRQYDHEVQGGSVVKPLTGALQIGPSDAAVVRPLASSLRGIAIGCGLAPWIDDAYAMAIAAVDEAVRNVVAVGADLARVALLDNFCWPGVEGELTMGSLVRACEGCRDASLAFGTPFISGKDSLNNQFTDPTTGRVRRIRPTLLISAIGVVADVRRCVTMDFKNRTGRVCLVRASAGADLKQLARLHRAMARAISAGAVAAAHDVSEGGVPVALAEMCMASGMGVTVGEEFFFGPDAFAEGLGMYLLEVAGERTSDKLAELIREDGQVVDVGLVQHLPKLTITDQGQRSLEIGLDELTAAWRGTLDW
jgi:phosphoribosylformylglycinamidine synthase subunit PurSL